MFIQMPSYIHMTIVCIPTMNENDSSNQQISMNPQITMISIM